MADFSGRKVAVGFGRETTRGVAVTPGYWVQHSGVDFQNKIKKVLNDGVMGVLDKYASVALVEEWSEGKVEARLTDQTVGLLIYAMLGSISSANHSGETTVKDHTITQAQSNQGVSLTVTRKDPNGDKNYPLAMIKTLELNIVVGDYVRVIAEFIGQKGVAGTDTVAYVAENDFKASNATVKFASLVAGLGAATAVPLKNLKITLTRTLNPYFIVGQTNVAEVYAEEFQVKGDMTLRYTDTTYEALWANNTNQAMLIDVKNTGVTIGSAANPEIQLTLPAVTLADWTGEFKISNIVEQKVAFQGMYDLTTGKGISAIVTNSVTSY